MALICTLSLSVAVLITIVNSEDYNSILKNEESIPSTNLVLESSSTRSKRVGTQKAYARLVKYEDATFITSYIWKKKW